MGDRFVLGEAPGSLKLQLRSLLLPPEKAESAASRLLLSLEHPVPEEQLRALWQQLTIRVVGAEVAEMTRQPDGSCCLSGLPGGGQMQLRLSRLLPCERTSLSLYEQGEESELCYVPEGCAMGLELEVEGADVQELEFSLPPLLQTRHGLGMGTSPQRLRVSLMPACPTLVGSGSNELALSGSHQLRLPCINVEGAQVDVWHWEAEAAARLLPVIQRGMRDDTIACNLLLRQDFLRRRAAEGLETEGMRDDMRREVTRALRLLEKERRWQEPLRARALAEASAYPSVWSAAQAQGSPLVQKGELLLDFDQLTGGDLRPGLYLVSVSSAPDERVRRALALYRQSPAAELELPRCTVDYLVLVSDISSRLVGNQLVVNSMATGEPLEGVQASAWCLPRVEDRETEEAEGGSFLAAEAQPIKEELPLPQGALCLPAAWEKSMLLLRRGEDYSLLVLQEDELRAVEDERFCEPAPPKMMLFSDRPLYRPGDLVHLRGVLRCPKEGGLLLPRAREVELSILKPNGAVMDQRKLPLDVYGAFTADFRLPEGEEDVAGEYGCRVRVEEQGQEVEEQLGVPCEVFRRDSFRVSLEVEAATVAAKECTVRVQAEDYNGSPLAGGRVELVMTPSGVPLRAAEGFDLEEVVDDGNAGRKKYRCQLVLNDAGYAEWKGCFGDYTQQRLFWVEASVVNEREEYVREQSSCRLSPADFAMHMLHDAQGSCRLMLAEVESDSFKPLAREQQVQLRVTVMEPQRRELSCGLFRLVPERRELLCRYMTVPASCEKGVDLGAELKGLEERLRGNQSARLELRGCDAAGHEVRMEQPLYFPSSSSRHLCEETDFCEAEVEGRCLKLRLKEPMAASGRLHVFVHSQGRLRHCLAEVAAGSSRLELPLTAQEYGSVSVTVVFCGKDGWGTHRRWHSLCSGLTLPRPDKELHMELTLPQGARPGEVVCVRGRVLDAEGRPVKAALTLFAVDAGMLSVSGSYTLPDFSSRFYLGRSDYLRFSHRRRNLTPCRPVLSSMPDVWADTLPGWNRELPAARERSVYPPEIQTWALRYGLGSLCHGYLGDVVSLAQPGFLWGSLLGLVDDEFEGSPAAAPFSSEVLSADIADGLGAGGAGLGSANMTGFAYASRRTSREALYHKMSSSYRAKALAEVDALWEAELPESAAHGAAPACLRHNFEPVALWQAALETDEDGRFCREFTLPDTLTTYKVYAVALDASGECFGVAENNFVVNQPLMLTAGTPFFMSLGDKLMLPLTITNNREEPGEWDVRLGGAGEQPTRHVALEGHRSTTLFFEVEAREEGICTLQWTAQSAEGGDAVQGSFPVRYPAPLLREAHRLVLPEGAAEQVTAGLLAEAVAASTRGEVEITCSSSPLVHLAGSLDFLLNYPYGCTEQRASALLPWLFHEQLAPFCPQMAACDADEVRQIVERSMAHILSRQQEDGGLSYWPQEKGSRAESNPWVSAYAALVLTLADEQEFDLPEAAMEKLRGYLGRQNWHGDDYLTQYAAARALGREGEVNRILVKALRHELKEQQKGRFCHQMMDLELMAELRSNPPGRHEALLRWLRSKGRDYRHASSWQSGWTLIALAEYLSSEPRAAGQTRLRLNGEMRVVEGSPLCLRLRPAAGQSLRDVAPVLAAEQGTVYVNLRVKAQPEQREYPGVTENGLQITRLYEVKGKDGQWREAHEFRVGEVVRVTLTCAKMADELEYLVVEDYLPACMEAINPNVPSQAAGLEEGARGLWSRCFDHKEYLTDRVRGFCTRWPGQEVLNMSYYARVKRAGESIAPPAEAQLMYEPQTFGLSPNTKVSSK